MHMPKLKLARYLAVPALTALLFASGAIHAVQADTKPQRIRGTLDSVSDTSIEVTSRGGQKMTLKLAPNLGVVAITKASLTEVKPGSYIGTAALSQSDGSLKALEVHIFPESMKGTGAGERPWDKTPDSKMLNGLVGSVVGTDGHSFMVQNGDKQTKVVVPENAPVVQMEPADRSLLKAGAKVIVSLSPDDKTLATRISVGKDGVTPPM